VATEIPQLLEKETKMDSGRKSKYDSLNLHVPDDLRQAFIDGFDEVGLHAGTVQCFSAKPTSIRNI
jgi:hypothetical protein